MRLRSSCLIRRSPYIRGWGRDCWNRFMRSFPAHELRKSGASLERQKAMPIVYDGIRFDEAFRSDLVVGEKVIVEIKSVAALRPVHAKQLLTQLRLSGLKLGLPINFGESHLRNGIKRVINGQLDEDPFDL